MKDQLEKFIKENRDQWNDREPRESNWARISQAVFGKEKVFFLNSVIFWRAAAFVLLGLSTFLFFYKQNSSSIDQQELVQQQDFSDIESFYSAQILEKVALISNEGLFADDSFTQDLQKLEAMYTVLAEEMKKQPSEKVKDALVLNMLVRIDLLNQQIQKLEESKRMKTVSTSI